MFFTDFETESGYDKLYISWTGCFGASRYDYDEMKQGDLGSVSVPAIMRLLVMFGSVLHDVTRGGERCEALHVFRWICAERVS